MDDYCNIIIIWIYNNKFYLVFVNYAGSPVIIDGQYYLQDHGKVIQNLKEHEYLQYQSVSVRFISCNLILFYSIVTSDYTNTVNSNKIDLMKTPQSKLPTN